MTRRNLAMVVAVMVASAPVSNAAPPAPRPAPGETSLRPVPVVEVRPHVDDGHGGLNWVDAAIGAAAAVGVMLIVVGGEALWTRKRNRRAASLAADRARIRHVRR